MSAMSKTRPIRTQEQIPIESATNFFVAPLTENERSEALNFLAVRPLHTVIMSGWMRDHGVVGPLNRGTFYCYRSASGKIEGIALIGKNTLFETRTGEALQALAQLARGCPDIRMVMAEGEKLSKFWYYYARPDQSPRSTCSELLFEMRKAIRPFDTISELRLATEEDLTAVAAVHAQMVDEETGVNPLVADPDGFLARCETRIKQNRVWVWVKDGELIFKTDVISETPEAVYIEGLWVNPNQRGKGFSKLCLANLCQRLLNHSSTICGFVDAENITAQSLYQKTGFSLTDYYAKIYL
jgi:ribosomal protein S18 acetylase RimI-like enzyme